MSFDTVADGCLKALLVFANIGEKSMSNAIIESLVVVHSLMKLESAGVGGGSRCLWAAHLGRGSNVV